MKIIPWRLDEPWNGVQRFVARVIVISFFASPFIAILIFSLASKQ